MKSFNTICYIYRFPFFTFKIILLSLLFLGYSIFLFAAQDLHFAVLGNLSLENEEYKIVINDIKQLHPDFIVTVGNLTSNGSAEEYEKIFSELRNLTIPIYFTPSESETFDNKSKELFKKYTNQKTFFSFNYENSHFIILDNTHLNRLSEMDNKQQKWLIADLEDNAKKNIYLFMNKPFWLNKNYTPEEDVFHQLIKEYDVTAVFFGGNHSYFYKMIDDVEYFSLGFSEKNLIHEDIDSVNFNHFLWCTIISDSLQTALIKSGLTFSKNYLTYEESNILKNIKNDGIRLYGSVINKKVEAILEARNYTNKTINDTVFIETKENWVSEFEKIYISLAPSEIKTYEINFKQKKEFYPLPSIKFSYPYSKDKIYQFDKFVEFMPVYSIKERDKPFELDTLEQKFKFKKFLKLDVFYSCGVNLIKNDPQLKIGADEEKIYVVFTENSTDELSKNISFLLSNGSKFYTLVLNRKNFLSVDDKNIDNTKIESFVFDSDKVIYEISFDKKAFNIDETFFINIKSCYENHNEILLNPKWEENINFMTQINIIK